jgi:hypothetical protein
MGYGSWVNLIQPAEPHHGRRLSAAKAWSLVHTTGGFSSQRFGFGPSWPNPFQHGRQNPAARAAFTPGCQIGLYTLTRNIVAVISWCLGCHSRVSLVRLVTWTILAVVNGTCFDTATLNVSEKWYPTPYSCGRSCPTGTGRSRRTARTRWTRRCRTCLRLLLRLLPIAVAETFVRRLCFARAFLLYLRTTVDLSPTRVCSCAVTKPLARVALLFRVTPRRPSEERKAEQKEGGGGKCGKINDKITCTAARQTKKGTSQLLQTFPLHSSAAPPLHPRPACPHRLGLFIRLFRTISYPSCALYSTLLCKFLFY